MSQAEKIAEASQQRISDIEIEKTKELERLESLKTQKAEEQSILEQFNLTRTNIETEFTKNFGQQVQGRLSLINAEIAKLKELAAQRARAARAGSGGGSSQGVDGFRAEGGPVSVGKKYVVGELGPELFVPKTSGTIIPNNQVTNNQTINLGGFTTQKFTNPSMLASDLEFMLQGLG